MVCAKTLRALIPTLALVLGTGACAGSTPAPVPTVAVAAPFPAAPDVPLVATAAPSPPRAPMPTMDLPKAADVSAPQVVLVVELHANGDISVDREKVSTDEELRAKVQRAVEKSGPELRAAIRADQTVKYGRLIHVMDQMKLAGVVKFAFAVAGPTQ